MSDKYKIYCTSKSSPFRSEGHSLANGICMQKVFETLVAPSSPTGGVPQCFPDHAIFSESPYLKAIYDPASIVSRHYEFPLDDAGFKRVQEIMVESLFSFLTPIQYLKMCLDVESKWISALESIGELSASWEATRCAKIETRRKYFRKYETRLEAMKKRYHAPFFKKSTNRNVELLDFAPINLHMQRLRVEKGVIPTISPKNSKSFSCDFSVSESSFTDYDVLTAGANTNHVMGYKHGGLLELLFNTDDHAKNHKSHKNPFESPTRLSRNQQISSEERLSERITTLYSQVKGRIEELKTLLSSNSSTSSSNDLTKDLNSSLTYLQKTVNDFLNCCDSPLITSCMTSLHDARPRYKHLYPVDASPTSSPTTSNNLSAFFTPENTEQYSLALLKQNCEEIKINLAKVTGLIQPTESPDLESFLKGESPIESSSNAIQDCLQSLHSSIEKLFSNAVSSLSFHTMKQNRKKVDPEIVFRRNSVFSQSLAVCACAVATLMTSHLNNQAVLEQFSEVGVLLHVESLLSTHGSEMGMIQDYAVGVSDLSCVTFRCVCSANQSMEAANFQSIDGFLPTMQGTINSPIIILPYDEQTFRQLPKDLQQGKCIKVYPVMFNVGINEEQTIAHRIGDTALQEQVNLDSYKKLSQYCKMVKKNCSISGEEEEIVRVDRRKTKKSPFKKSKSEEYRSIDSLLKCLNAAIVSKKHKNVEIHHLAAEICRLMNGIRVVSCKSAKDRTAMAVTLDQARILRDHHSLAPNAFTDTLNCMRSEGTRLENTRKNTGFRLYAFSHLQLKTFPKLYKPPSGTYGKGES